jgi:hypothetical protein
MVPGAADHQSLFLHSQNFDILLGWKELSHVLPIVEENRDEQVGFLIVSWISSLESLVEEHKFLELVQLIAFLG